MSLVDFAELCLIDDKVDKELDEELISIMEMPNGPEIIESRLAGHWAKKKKIKCKRIWLKVNEEIRAEKEFKKEKVVIYHMYFSPSNKELKRMKRGFKNTIKFHWKI